MDADTLTNTVYLFSAIAFVAGFRLLRDTASARNGSLVIAVGVAAALAVSLLDARVERLEYVLAGMAVGAFAGLQIVRRNPADNHLSVIVLLGGLGGLANLLVAWAEFFARPAGQGLSGGIALALAVIFGGISFSGSLAVWRKLNGKFPVNSVFPKVIRRYAALALAAGIFLSGILFAADTVAPMASRCFAFLSAFSLILGVLGVSVLDDVDMLAAVCLLSACAGAAVAASGFVIQNTLLVASGGLVVGSGVASAMATKKIRSAA